MLRLDAFELDLNAPPGLVRGRLFASPEEAIEFEVPAESARVLAQWLWAASFPKHEVQPCSESLPS